MKDQLKPEIQALVQRAAGSARAEQTFVDEQLRSGRRFVFNSKAKGPAIVHAATCRTITPQMDREVAWRPVIENLIAGVQQKPDVELEWLYKNLTSSVLADMPKLIEVGDLATCAKYRACATCQPLIPKHIARVPSILATSINEAHVGQSFETLDGEPLGVLAGVKVLLEFEGGETLQIERDTRVKVTREEDQPLNWSLSPYVPPRTAAEAAATLAAIPTQIAVEQETVRQQLATRSRFVMTLAPQMNASL